jgi:hypothetical protein
MPNNITNNISCYGNRIDIKNMWKQITDYSSDIKRRFVDFNLIARQPEGLNNVIEMGNLKEMYNRLLQERESGVHDTILDGHIDGIHTEHKKVTLRENAELFERCGCKSWYGWNIENWGTKWNSYEPRGPRWKNDIFTFSFETAWSPPSPILHKLAEMYPNITIVNVWIDEGGPMGFILSTKGQVFLEQCFHYNVNETELMKSYLEIKEVLKEDIHVYDIFKPLRRAMEGNDDC